MQAQAGIQRIGTPRQDQKAGQKRQEAQAERGRGSVAGRIGRAQARRIESPGVQAGGVDRDERRRPQGGRREDRNKPRDRCQGVGIEGASRRDDPKGWATTSDTGRKGRARSQRFQLDGIARGLTTDRGARREPNP